MANETRAPLTLIILTPHGEIANIACDSVHLTLTDDENGHGGGLAGFRRGHLPAVAALGNGPAEAKLCSKTVLHAMLHGGFASVRDDIIRVITDSASDIRTDSE